MSDEQNPDITDALAIELARELATARLEGRLADTDRLPPPADMAMAELVRNHTARFIERALSTHVTGWKIGCSSERAMATLGVDEPFAGALFETFSHHGDATVPVRAGGINVPEPEFAFRMALELAPRPEPFSEEEVAAAVDTVHPAMEIVDPRVVGGFGASPHWLVADGGVSHMFVYGNGSSDWSPDGLKEHPVTLHKNGTFVGEGTGAEALGGPLTALTWLANHLRQRGETLKPRDFVTTGIVTPIVNGVVGDRFDADFGTLGKISVTYGAW